MFLQGYGPLLLNGTWQTVKLAVLSLAFAFVLGLLGAAAKLSKNRFSYGVGTVYTTLVRGVPDLVLMLLLFYSIQIWLNNLTDLLGWDQIDIDPFVAGVAGARLHLRRVLHRNLPRRVSRGAARPAGSRRALTA